MSNSPKTNKKALFDIFHFINLFYVLFFLSNFLIFVIMALRMIYYLFTLDLTGWEFLALMLAYFLAIALAFSSHEFAHAITAKWCGDKTAESAGRISLNPFKHIDKFGALSFLLVGFGWAKPVPVNPLQFRNYKRGIRLVSSAGIITNFVLFIIFSCMFHFITPLLNLNKMLQVFVYFFLYLSMSLNLSLALFNILPIYPLDGFNYLTSFMRPDNKFAQFMYRYGNLILLIIIILPIFDIVYYYAVGGIQTLMTKFWGLF